MQFLPLPAERGAIVGGMVLARDITRQRLAERQLEASRHQLAEAQRIAQVGSWEWDVVANEVTVSDELCRLIGLPLGSRWTMEEGVARLIPRMEIEQVERLVERMRTDPSPYAHEHRMVASDGSIRTFLARGEGMVDEDGRVVRFIDTDQDITERRQADAERRRLLNRVYEVQEGQDRRLAADLHDGHVQSLAAIGFKLEQARLRLGASCSPEVDDLLWQVTKDLSSEVTSLRRTIGRLRPLVLVEDGLEAALREEAKSACNRPPWSPARSPRSWTGGWTRWWRRPCSGSPSRPWPTWSTMPRRPAPWSRSSAPATAWSCGSATTAAASTSTTCGC